MSDNQLATRKQAEVAFNEEQVAILKESIAPGATDGELRYFMEVCQHLELDPFAGHIYAIKRWDNKKQKEVIAIQVAVDGRRLIAARTGEYLGQLGPLWCGEDGKWHDVWLSKNHPAAAKVGIIRKGFTEPVWGVAIWDEYVQTYKAGNQTVLMPMWVKMGANQLAKCAENQGLKKAFPQESDRLASTIRQSGFTISEDTTEDTIPAMIDTETGEIIDGEAGPDTTPKQPPVNTEPPQTRPSQRSAVTPPDLSNKSREAPKNAVAGTALRSEGLDLGSYPKEIAAASTAAALTLLDHRAETAKNKKLLTDAEYSAILDLIAAQRGMLQPAQPTLSGGQ